MHRFTENVKVTLATMNVGTATSGTVTTGTSVDMAKYNNFCGLIGYAIASATGDVIVYIRESTDASVWTSTYLSSATIASAITPYIGCFGTIECRAEQMTDGYRYLRLEAIPAAQGGYFAMANMRFNSRYPQATLPA